MLFKALVLSRVHIFSVSHQPPLDVPAFDVVFLPGWGVGETNYLTIEVILNSPS